MLRGGYACAAEAGYVLGVDIATNELLVAVSDLTGNLLATRHEESDVSDGPEAIFTAIERMGDELLDETGFRDNLWSVGLGMPGPVAFDDGDVTAMPTMPDWDRFPTRARLAARWKAPVWMDNRVNLSALGERRVNPLAAASQHTIYLGGGEAIGAAVVVDGRIYRGARGLAGEIGHVPVPEAGGRRRVAAATPAASTPSRDGRLWSATAGCWPRPVRARPWPPSSPRPARSGRSTSRSPPTRTTRLRARCSSGAPACSGTASPRWSASSIPTSSSSAAAWLGPAPT